MGILFFAAHVCVFSLRACENCRECIESKMQWWFHLDSICQKCECNLEQVIDKMCEMWFGSEKRTREHSTHTQHFDYTIIRNGRTDTNALENDSTSQKQMTNNLWHSNGRLLNDFATTLTTYLNNYPLAYCSPFRFLWGFFANLARTHTHTHTEHSLAYLVDLLFFKWLFYLKPSLFMVIASTGSGYLITAHHFKWNELRHNMCVCVCLFARYLRGKKNYTQTMYIVIIMLACAVFPKRTNYVLATIQAFC